MISDDGPNGGRGRATITDVARAAGVSIKSVSRVINNEQHVTDRLRAKVRTAIGALNYVPDTAARSLAGARSFTIGILFDNPSPNYTIKVQAGAYRACIENGYHLRIDNLDSSAGEEHLRRQLERVLDHSRIDGFVLTPPLTDERVVLDQLERRHVRYSRIAPVTDPGRSQAVCIDDAAAAAQMAELLWSRGHRRVGLVNGPANHGAAGRRRQGFVERFNAYGGDGHIFEAPGDFTFTSGMVAGKTLVAAPCRPTAIFAVNDDMAAGVMTACVERGLIVPQDVSVVGFDDSWIATSVWPSLTTVYQPIEEMAAAAVLCLVKRGDDTQDAFTELQLDFRIVVRASLAGSPDARSD